MKTSAWNATLLTTLLIAAPAASKAAGQQPPSAPAAPAAPEAAPAPPAPESAPAPPAPPSARKRTKKIIVTSPDEERRIVVDGDRVFITGDDDDADRIADIEGFEGPDGRPFAWKMNGGGGFIGVRPIEMTPELRQHFGAPRDAGILVGSVEADGPAAKAGLQVGDVVTKIDGDPVDSTRELVRLVRHKKGGETVTLELLRDKASKRLTVTVAERRDREMRIGELPTREWAREWSRDWPRDWSWESKAPRADESRRDLEKRLDDLEKKLKQLEGRLPSR